MAPHVLAENARVDTVTYELPNKHYLLVDMVYIGVDNVSP
jgi:urate oxidase